jgi:adenylate kinase
MALNVIMMGPPGAGKGTQAGRFANERGLPKISTGDILRDAIKAKNPTALAVKERMDSGELVDDTMIIDIVTDRLAKPDVGAGFVLDGFPRTVAQARALDELMERLESGPLIVVNVAVPEQELVRRLAGRLICSACGTNAGPRDAGSCTRCGGQFVQRADDEQGVVLERLRVYQQSTKPVLEYYRGRPTFRIVNGAQPPERVAFELNALIDEAAAARNGSSVRRL